MKTFFLYNYEKFSNNFFKKPTSAFVFLAKFKKLRQNLKNFRRNSVTYGTPCRAIGHFVFLLSLCYLQNTMPGQWSSSDFLLLVLKI